MTGSIAAAALAAFLGCSIMLVVLRGILRSCGQFDIPNSRSSHSIPVPRGGGVALILAAVAGCCAFTVFGTLQRVTINAGMLWAMLGVAVSMGLLGAVDDFRTLSAKLRLVVQVCLALAGSTWLLASSGHGLELLPICAFVCLAYVNITNFMDGVNGISGMHGVVAGAAYLAIGTHLSDVPLQVVATVVISTSLAFLPWNALRARLFLGDSGSYFLGGSVAAMAIQCLTVGGVAVEVAFAPMAIYVADTAWTILRRVGRREQLLQAHRSHVYQRLTDCGWTHLRVAALVTAATAGVTTIVAIGAALSGVWRPFADVVAVAVIGGYIAAPTYVARLRQRWPHLTEVSHD